MSTFYEKYERSCKNTIIRSIHRVILRRSGLEPHGQFTFADGSQFVFSTNDHQHSLMRMLESIQNGLL